MHERTALVTGASGGIGTWIARLLASAEMNVAVCARREDALAAVGSELRELEVVETGSPVRPMLALAQLAPRLPERVSGRIGATELFRRAAEARDRA